MRAGPRLNHPEPQFGYTLLVSEAGLTVEHVDDVGMANRLVRLHTRATRSVEERLGLPVPNWPHVVIAPNDQEFTRRYRLLAGQRPAHSVLAAAFAGFNRILIRQSGLREGTDAGLFRTYKHELAHLCLAPLERRRGQPLPRWLNEGLAEWSAGREPTSPERASLAGWSRFGTLPSLESLSEAFPQHGNSSARSYTVSMAFVCWLEGYGSIAQLLEALDRGPDLDLAFRIAFSRDVQDLEREWISEQKDEHSWIKALVFSLNVWTVTALLAIVAILRHIVVTRRLKRELRLADLEEDERESEETHTVFGEDPESTT
jgi:hypothetical protein